MKKLIFGVLVACVCAYFARAEQVQSWFAGGVQGSSPTSTNGGWTSPSDGVVTTNASSFTVEILDATKTLDFKPAGSTAPDTNVMTRVVSDMKFTAHNGTLPTPNARTAIMVSNVNYYAYAKVGDDMGWIRLAGDPDTENVVKVLVEIDYKTSSPRVRWGIIVGNETNFLNIAGSPDAWLELAEATPTPAIITDVSFGGEGEVVSVRGDVQLGVASYDGVKYPTVQDAVDVAGTTENAKVTVLRDNNETITIAENQKIELDTNGKESGAIVNHSDTPVNVDVKVPEATVAKGSGTYSIAVDVTGSATVKTVTTSDTSKEAAGTIVERGGKKYLDVIVRTSADVMNNVKFDGKAVASADNESYRAFLTNYCGAAGGAYMKANTTAAAITTQLGEEADNGLPLWESYVLGLDPDDATSKPATVVKPATEDAANMILTVPTYKATLPVSNYKVKYVLTNLTDKTSSTIDNPAAIAVPFDGDQYRVDTVITPNKD